MGVLLVTGATTVSGEVELIPPLQFRLGWQRVLAGRLVADQIAADRDQRLDPLRPQRRDNVGRTRTPVIATEHRLLDLQGIHEVDDITGQCSRLAIAQGFVGQEMRIAITPGIGHQHPITLGGQQRRNLIIAMNVVRPAVQQDHHRPVGRACFCVRHVQQPGVDMLERAEGRGRRLGGTGRDHGWLRGGGRLRVGRTEHAEQRQREDRRADQVAASLAGFAVAQCHLHGMSPLPAVGQGFRPNPFKPYVYSSAATYLACVQLQAG
ncbi:hypothetical protein D3C81_1130330 [compost metagenome]